MMGMRVTASEGKGVDRTVRLRWWIVQRRRTYSIWAVRRLNPLAIE